MDIRSGIALAVVGGLLSVAGGLWVKNLRLTAELSDAQLALVQQSAAVTAAANAGQLTEATAAADAHRALLRGARSAATLPSVGRGPEAMNQWLHATFAP